MPLPFPRPTHLPCPDCGASVAATGPSEHGCEPERRLEYQLVQMREEIGAFDAELARWLETAEGRFAAWLADRARGAR
jgi:hypothetical protein